MATLSTQQQLLLDRAKNLTPVIFADGSTYNPGYLVSGHYHRTAVALERKGLGVVRYQGTSMGWFSPCLDKS